jgi:lysophospholipid acyltransferase (LPLAT)-like uncharacterized protein
VNFYSYESEFMNYTLEKHIRAYMPEMTASLLWTLSRLVRTKIVGFEQVEQLRHVNVAHWHGDEMIILPRFGSVNPAILVSHSKDGEMMARGARYLGYHVVRGSSSRGAVGGLIALIKASRDGHHAALAVDGPKGPRGVCKPGVVYLSQKTGVPLLPVGVAVSRKFIFEKTWNKVYLPLPLSRQVLFFDRPLYFGTEKDLDSITGYCGQVEEALHKASRRAQKILNQW